MTSISPFFIAATALAPGADADDRGVRSASAPALTIAYCAVSAVEEPGAVTPIFSALEVGRRLDLAGPVLLDRDDDRREAAELDDGANVLALRLHADRVLVGARDDVDGAADQRLQRLARRRRNR